MSDLLQIICGDALEELRKLPDESVQMCCTSPPYWGLRDYGTGTWEGGDAACAHKPAQDWINDAGDLRRIGANALQANEAKAERRRGYACQCGAVRVDKQLGLEKTPEEFVAKMVKIFEEVRRVLKSDGTCWVNLGDSYAASRSYQVSDNKNPGAIPTGHESRSAPPPGLKQKDLVGIPWRVAFALQAAGWYLRSDIIWHKPNPMPESVTDRPTKSHEYLFLLSKSERYYYDHEAIKEPVTGNAHARGDGVSPKAKYKTPDGWDTTKGSGGHGSFHRTGREDGQTGYEHKPRAKQNESFSAAVIGLVDTRNKRTVWTVPTYSYADAHFATYPPDLIKPCILAGSRPGDTILDPFGGSGTTGQVAMELGRRALLIELNPEYVALIEQRCNVTPGLGF